MRVSTRRRLPGLDPNYPVVLQTMMQSGEIPMVPGVRHMVVADDDGCAIWRGGVCDCSPEITVGEYAPIA